MVTARPFDPARQMDDKLSIVIDSELCAWVEALLQHLIEFPLQLLEGFTVYDSLLQ
jgi:hypothetical protein